MTAPLILASTSITRRRILENAGVAFEAVSPSVDEDALKQDLRTRGLSPEAIAVALGEAKAVTISHAQRDALVIGADQILVLDDGAMLDKAQSREEAVAHLQSLSARDHRLISALAVASAGQIIWNHVAIARLAVRPLTNAFIADYVERNWQDIRHAVGCYHVEGPGAQLFSCIEGDYFDIMGLPLLPLLGFLREQGVLPS